MRRAGTLFLLTVAIASTSAASAGVGVAGRVMIEPRSLVLQPADVGQGMRQVNSTPVTSALLDAHPGGVPHGFVTGWEAAFVADGPVLGIVQVRSTVGLYVYAADARSAVVANYRAVKPPKGWRLARMVAARVGDLTRMVVFRGPGPWGGVTTYVVSWTSGNVQAGVALTSITRTVRPSEATALALRQQARIAPLTDREDE